MMGYAPTACNSIFFYFSSFPFILLFAEAKGKTKKQKQQSSSVAADVWFIIPYGYIFWRHARPYLLPGTTSSSVREGCVRREWLCGRDGELWERHCLKLLSLCYRYVMLTETPGGVGNPLGFFSLLVLLYLIIAFLGRCVEAFRSLSFPLTHCHPSCPAFDYGKK